MTFNEIPSVLKEKDKIVILPHVSADGDSIGSSLALALALGKLGKHVKIYIEEKVPQTFEFLPGLDIIEIYKKAPEETVPGEVNIGSEAFEVAVALDTGDEGRLGNRLEILKASAVTINIDHHATNTMFAQYNHVQPNSSSVGELMYQLLKEMDIDIDVDISTCLYVSILTDTGGFRYSNTTSLTHKVVSSLINYGVETAEICRRIFETRSCEKVKLMGLVISNLEFFHNGKIAYASITKEHLNKAGSKNDDSEGFVDIGRSIIGVEVSVLLRETEDGSVKVNLRSNSYVDVSEIAVSFCGGGHKRAAGFKSSGKASDVKEQILNAIRKKL